MSAASQMSPADAGTEPEYDAFLSYASEDGPWCEHLAERLRNEGVRVWFDKWHIRPGDHLSARIDDGLEKSRKLIAVWSPHYFRDDKVWARAESYSRHHPDVLSRERPLIPLLIADCRIKPTFSSLVHIDFRNPADFDLRIRQLVEALDLPRRDLGHEEESELVEHDRPTSERRRRSQGLGKGLEDDVAALYRLLGFDVTLDREIGGVPIGLEIRKREGGMTTLGVVACNSNRITASERDHLLAQQNVAKKKWPKHRWIAVSGVGFAADARIGLEEAGYDCVTYAELLRDLVPLESYVDYLIADYGAGPADRDHRSGEGELFIRPNIEADVTYERRPALAHIARWLGDSRANLLVILGDLGTGKTTLSRFVAYQMALSFKSDALRHPAPILIPLREVRKEVALESIVVKHFRDRGLAVDFQRFEHLVREGKIVLFFDAFDEMADRVRWDVTQANFQELRRAAVGKGKVILTCRTHYFKDRTEQTMLIGQGPSLTAAETALYKELRQQAGAEVAYLQEFDDEQIQEYLRRARGAHADEDWRKIHAIYNLRDLAQRPLLLDMIVKSLPRLHEGQTLNAASLYTVYTNAWVDRDFVKGRVVLTRETKLALMMELAGRMWADEKTTFTTGELAQFVGALHAGRVLELGDEEVEDIAREVQTASFLRRERDGRGFGLMHRSFGEFFLARKIQQALTNGETRVLDTRRFDRKVVYFLTLLDDGDRLRDGLQSILTNPYTKNVSENALQILYWGGRIRHQMREQLGDEQIGDLARLRAELASWLPAGIQLAAAQLQEIVLEAARFRAADYSGADLTKGNLNDAELFDSRFGGATLVELRAERIVCAGVDFSEADFRGATLAGGALSDCNLSSARLDASQLASVQAHDVVGVAQRTRVERQRLAPTIQLGASSAVTALAWCRHGDVLATGDAVGIIRLYRGSDGRQLRALEGHEDRVTSVAFDTAGATLASGSDDGTVKLWATASSRLLRTLVGHHGWVTSVAFDAAGETLASGSYDRTVKVWEAPTGRLLHTFDGHHGWVTSIALDAAGVMLASGSNDQTVKLWHARSGRLLQTLDHRSHVGSVALGTEAAMLASVGGYAVKLWDTRTGRLLHTLDNHPNQVRTIALDTAGATLASGGDGGAVKLWEATSGRLLGTLAGHQSGVLSVAFDGAGETLASGSHDRTIKLWEVSSGRLLRTLDGHQGTLTSVAFDRAGAMLASGSGDRTVKLWDARSGRALYILDGHRERVTSVAFDAMGGTLASGSHDRTVKQWDASTGRLLRTLVGHQDCVTSVAFDAAGETLASGSDDRTVALWDTRSGQLRHTLRAHQGIVTSVAFDAAGTILASGSHDRTAMLWDARSGRVLHTLDHRAWVTSVMLDASGQTLASGGDDRTVNLWEPRSGRLVRTLDGHQSFVTSLAFDPSGAMLASGSYDRTVKLWESRSGRFLNTLEGHLGPVFGVCFSPSGTCLIAAGRAGRLQFWDVKRAETFLFLYSFGPGAWLALLPDGRFDASPEALRYLCYTERETLTSFTAEELVKEFHDPDAIHEVLARYHLPPPSAPLRGLRDDHSSQA